MLASPPLKGRRASSSCLAVAGRLGARSPLTVPAAAALPWLRGFALDLPPFQLVGAPRARTRELAARAEQTSNEREAAVEAEHVRPRVYESYTRGRTCADRCGKSAGCLAGSAV